QQRLVEVEGPGLGVQRHAPDLALVGDEVPQAVGDVVERFVLRDVPVERRDVPGVGPGGDVDVRRDDDVGRLAGLEAEQDAPAVVVPADRLEVGLDGYAVVGAALLQGRVHAL